MTKNTICNINNAKNIITSKFKEKLWCEENLTVKRKLRYYKEVINPNMEDQNYLLVVISLWKKINIPRLEWTLMNSIAKQGVVLSLKLHIQKGFVICVSLWVLRMTVTFSLSALLTPTLDLSFIVFSTIHAFIAS